MPRKSATDNVRKICGCVKWKTCSHPWYLWAQRDGVRYRVNLDKLLGRHITDYQQARDEAHRALLSMRDGRDPSGLVPEDDPTLAQLLADYDREKPRRDRWQIGKLIATPMRGAEGIRPFGEWRLCAITADSLKTFRTLRPRVAGNRDLTLLRAAFRWAVVKGLLERSPFRVGDVPVVKVGREDGRTRRLYPGEYERLFDAVKSRRLHDLFVAAVETGMRKGELLSLQVHQVRFTPKAEVFLPAAKTKTKKDRRVPLSSVARRVIESRLHDPAGEPLPMDAYVFGNEIGARVAFPKKAWEHVALVAHGHRPTYRIRRNAKGRHVGRGAMTRESRAVLRDIDLNFHDLRREAGSRWMDVGIPLATIQRWLGHANISQTSTYLGASLGGDEQDMRAYEERIGRLADCQKIANPAPTTVFSGASTDLDPSGNAPKNTIVH